MRKHSSQLPVTSSQEKLAYQRRKGGFTLIEFVIVISVILILSVAVFLILDPVQIAARSRDTNRVSDFEALIGAIDFASAEAVVATDNWDPDGAYDGDADPATQSCSGEGDQRVFISVPSDNGETDPDNLPNGWSYARVTDANLQNIDGTGWLPVDFTVSGAVQSSISHLPIDTINTFASGFYYSYVCSRTSRKYELNLRMASEQYRTGGTSDAQADDGGDDIFVYETGSDLSLNPKAPVGYWPFDGGTSGAIADNDTVGFEDISGSGNNGRADNNNASGMNWVAGVRGGAVDLDGTDDYVQVTSPILSGGSDISIVLWLKMSAPQASSWRRLFSDTGGGAEIYFTSDGTNGIYGRIGDSTTWWIMSSPDLTGDVWFQVAIVTPSSGTKVDSYLNGSFYTSGSQANTFSTVTLSDFLIGTSSTLNNFLNGTIDEMAIYERVLTAEEIAYQYNTLKP